MCKIMPKMLLITSVFYTNLVLANASHEFFSQIESVNTYQASFEQIIKDDTGRVIASSKGTMLVKRPNRFYWQTIKPDPIKVIADGKNLWNYDIELEQVTKQDLKKTIKNSPAAILAGEVDEFKKSFNVQYAQNCKPGTNCYSLKSLDEDPIFSDMHMVMQGNKLVEISMTDQMGQYVSTKFTQVKVNNTIDDNKFKFTPPKGVDVVEMGKD